MTCEGFDQRLDALLDGACSPAEWREAESHLEGCARCRRLFEALAGRGAALDGGAGDALTATIIGRTTGGTCESAHDRLCDFVDGLLDEVDRELVRGHLDHCQACAELAGALERTHAVLPGFSEIGPPAWFEQRVLSATSRRPVTPTIGDRLAAWLGRAAQRPRFAIEAAYACTLVLVLVFGNPVKAFREVSTSAQPGVERAAQSIGRPIANVRAAGAGAISSVEQKFKPVVKSLASETRARALAISESAVQEWIRVKVTDPLRQIAGKIWTWAQAVRTEIDRLVGAPSSKKAVVTEP